VMFCIFFQAEDGIRDFHVTGVQTCALPIYLRRKNGRYLHALTRFADWLGARRSPPPRDPETGLIVALHAAIECLPQEERSLLDRSEERRVGKERRAQ